MSEKTAKTIAQIRYSKHDGVNRITIPKDLMKELDLTKGDFIELRIRKVMRPTTEVDE